MTSQSFMFSDCAIPRRQPKYSYDWNRPHSAGRGYGYQHRQARLEYLAANPNCRRCGREATQVDHIVALADGGADEDHNKQPLCGSCHSRKTVYFNRGFGRDPMPAEQLTLFITAA